MLPQQKQRSPAKPHAELRGFQPSPAIADSAPQQRQGGGLEGVSGTNAQRTPTSRSLLSELLLVAVQPHAAAQHDSAPLEEEEEGHHHWADSDSETEDEDDEMECVSGEAAPATVSKPMLIPNHTRKDISGILKEALRRAQVAELLEAQQLYEERLQKQQQAQDQAQHHAARVQPGF